MADAASAAIQMAAGAMHVARKLNRSLNPEVHLEKARVAIKEATDELKQYRDCIDNVVAASFYDAANELLCNQDRVMKDCRRPFGTFKMLAAARTIKSKARHHLANVKSASAMAQVDAERRSLQAQCAQEPSRAREHNQRLLRTANEAVSTPSTTISAADASDPAMEAPPSISMPEPSIAGRTVSSPNYTSATEKTPSFFDREGRHPARGTRGRGGRRAFVMLAIYEETNDEEQDSCSCSCGDERACYICTGIPILHRN